ncbi:MAG: redoxin domain-containing protein [Bacteroidetes bacterium]|nr:MAG: redoxin domain-containing protein [Bacteroidota bacterium]
MRNLYLVSILFLLTPCAIRAQAFTVFDSFSDLEKRIQKADANTTLVLNFWATWCSPCVEELPCFEELNRNFTGPGFEVILVSLDFKSQLDKRFLPFLEKQQLKSEVVLLADQDADSWIPKVHPKWEGALPATVVIRGGQRAFYPDQFENYQELETFVFDFVKKTRKAMCLDSKGTR